MLQKTQEIEEKEEDLLQSNAQKRAEKANQIRSKNATLSSNAQAEIMFRGEEAERREVIVKVKQYASELGMTSLVNLLEKFEGKYQYIYIYINYLSILVFILTAIIKVIAQFPVCAFSRLFSRCCVFFPLLRIFFCFLN